MPSRFRRPVRLRVERLEDRTMPVAGNLDPGFGAGGVMTLRNDLFAVLPSDPEYLPGSGHPSTVGATPGGGVVLGGPVSGETVSGNPVNGFAFRRLTAAGQPDPSYGDGGRAYVYLGASNLHGYAGRVTADGGVVFAGVTVLPSGAEAVSVYRLTPAGVPDLAFGPGGMRSAVIRPPGAESFMPTGEPHTAVLADGGVVVVGVRDTHFSHNLNVARVTPAVALDPTFDADGVAGIPLTGTFYPTAVSVQPDGIVVAGNETVAGGTALAAVRVRADGSLDTTFGTNGEATVAFDGSAVTHAVVVQPGGGIVLLGQVTLAGYPDPTTGVPGGGADATAAARLTPAGQPDPAFGARGRAVFRAVEPGVGAAAVQPDGAVVLTSLGSLAVTRLTPDGVPDQTFGDGGVRAYPTGTTFPGYTSADPVSLALLPNGDVLVAGSVGTSAGNALFSDFFAARLLRDVAPSPLSLAPPAVPAAVVGRPYSASLAAPGATTFTITAGALPDGLTLGPAGTIAGTPTAAACGPLTQFTVTAADGQGHSVSQVYTMPVYNAPAVGPAAVPGGTVGLPYRTVTFTAPGAGAPPGAYGLTLSSATFTPDDGGPVVAGLGGLNFSNGQLGGTTTAAGTVRFTVTTSAADTPAGTVSGSRDYATHFADALPAALPDAVAGTPYDVTLFTPGPNSPTGLYHLQLAATEFVPDLAIGKPAERTDGLTTSATPSLGITGRPDFPGTMTIRATLTHETSGAAVTKEYTLRVIPSPITFAPSIFPSALYVGTPYDIPITASGPAARYDIAHIPVVGAHVPDPGLGIDLNAPGFAIPDGMTFTFDPVTGTARLAGTPAAVSGGSFHVRLQATDPATGDFALVDYAFGVDAAGRLRTGQVAAVRLPVGVPIPDVHPLNGFTNLEYNVFAPGGDITPAVIFGELPPGTHFQKTVVTEGTYQYTRFRLLGTPTAGGNYYGTVQFDDGAGHRSAERFYVIVTDLSAPTPPAPPPPPAPAVPAGPPLVLPPVPASTPTHSYSSTTEITEAVTNTPVTTELYRTQIQHYGVAVQNGTPVAVALADAVFPVWYDPTNPAIAAVLADDRAALLAAHPDQTVDVYEYGFVDVTVPYDGPLPHTPGQGVTVRRFYPQTYRTLTASDTTPVEIGRTDSLLETVTVDTVGPATVRVGPNGSETLFVPAGTVNTNTVTRVRRDIYTTTSQTYTTTKYVFVGSHGVFGPGSGATAFTTTSRTLPGVVDSNATATAETAATRVVGTFNGVRYDVTLNVPYDPADPDIRAAVAAAAAANRAAGAAAGGAVVVGAPVRTRAGSATTVSETTTTLDPEQLGTPGPPPFPIDQLPHEFDGFTADQLGLEGGNPGGGFGDAVRVTKFVGPTTYLSGDEMSQPFFVSPGDTSVDILVDAARTTDRVHTTTTTYQTLTTIQVDGAVDALSPPPASPPPPAGPPPAPPGHVFLRAVGADAGGGPRVRAFRPDGSVALDALVFEPGFAGGVRVATGDVTGDGVDDVLAAAGDGGGPRVVVLDGATGGVVRSFFAFDDTLRVGAFVAAADVNGDGFADYAVTAGTGGGPRVAVFDGKTGTRLVADFFAFDPAARTGFTVALGDLDGDGAAEAAVGQFGGGSELRVFSLAGARLAALGVYEPTFAGGVNLSAGDFDGDGRTDLLVGAGDGGGPRVRAFRLAGGALGEIGNGFSFDSETRGGVRVGTAVAGTAGLVLAGFAGRTRSATAGVPAAGDDAPFGPDYYGGVWVS